MRCRRAHAGRALAAAALVCTGALSVVLGGCGRSSGVPAAAAGPAQANGVSAAVARAHAAARERLQSAADTATEDARRGFIAAPRGQVRGDDGEVVWDFDAFGFVQGEAPPTVSPGLWRIARLNGQAGLYRVAEGIWQLRGFDLANITLIQGRSGWIVVDALTSRETARAAMAFARLHLGDQPVSALVFTHSHIDHFGGALGIIDADEARRRRIPIVAPAGFVEAATRENVMMGIAMGRRAAWMYGQPLPRGATGAVDAGLGRAVALGRSGILPPTVLVGPGTQTVELDGLRFVFHDASGSEAPAGLVFALPQLKAFCAADLSAHTLHNLYTLRGAEVRDALKWVAQLDAMMEQADGAEVLLHQHQWPVWGAARIRDFIAAQRDAYRYIHDQTVRLMNAGLNADEIAARLRLPQALQRQLALGEHYGTVSQNARAVYQHYLGWFDGHPARLDPLPPVEAAQRYVALAGGPARLREAARQAHDAGDLRWAAELLRHAVLADPKDREARELLARSFEQMAWLAESAPWRNVYLAGAREARLGPPDRGIPRETVLDVLQHTPIERFLEAMAASVDGPRAEDLDLTLNLTFSDLGVNYVLRLRHAVLHSRRAPPAPDAQATLTLTRPFFLRMVVGQAGALDLLLSDQTRIQGSTVDLARFFAVLDKPSGTFPLVTR